MQTTIEELSSEREMVADMLGWSIKYVYIIQNIFIS